MTGMPWYITAYEAVVLLYCENQLDGSVKLSFGYLASLFRREDISPVILRRFYSVSRKQHRSCKDLLLGLCGKLQLTHL
jgi:hypothetical protein